MKVPMKWLREYVDIKVDVNEYARRMVMSGTGVEGIQKTGSDFEGVVVGRVLSCEDHPNSDHLHVCMVDVGREAPLQIVCGAPNVRAGILVPVALEGARLPGGVIKKGKLRGVESFGMICSGPELNIPAGLYPHVGDEGILIINEDVSPGVCVKEVLGLGDDVVDFEILANRPDCLSIWGIAHESAAVMGEYCVMPEIEVEEKGAPIEAYASVEVRDAALCPRYAARAVTNVKIGPSPKWMREYLNAAGVRPINNIVDITNFVMLETGHPMHAFDLSKVRDGKIIVRRAKPGEMLTTLDGKKHELTDSMLVIADAENATGLAGIMGGEESEIGDETTSVLFECAAFDRTSIRLTSRALGIRTESSARFEKGVCVENTVEALDRAAMLVNMLACGDVAPGIIDLYPNPAPAREITASAKRMARLMSVDVPAEKMEDILNSLYIDCTLTDDELVCVPPAWRSDIETEADLAEEVLRLYGYDAIPSTLPRGATMLGERSKKQAFRDRVKEALVGMGFYEALNYSFVSPKWLDAMDFDAGDWRLDPLPIRNPLGEDTSVMRTTLVPSMLAALSTNVNRGNAAGRIFELSTAFKKAGAHQLPVEIPTLTLGMYGEGVDFYALRDAVVCLLQRFGIEAKVEPGGENWLHPGRRAVVKAGDTALGQLGEVHPDVAARFELENRRIYIAELSIEDMMACEVPVSEVKPLPRFPAVSRDIALVMDEAVGIGSVMETIRRAAGRTLEDVKLFDLYRGAQVGAGKKSAAFSLSFRASDRTLTDAEVNASFNKIVKACETTHGAKLRA
jgi:phenylalanyl-tRNA synthetase beta chain